MGPQNLAADGLALAEKVYISFKKKNYRIPKSMKPEELSLEECREIIEKAGSRTKK